MSSCLSEYIELIDLLKADKIAARQFEHDFLFLFKNDEESTNYPEAVVEILESLFGVVDEYCDDPELRQKLPQSSDERELRSAAYFAGDRLRALADSSGDGD